MKTAIVVETKADCDLLRAIMPSEALSRSQFVLALNRNRLSSVATTLLAVEKTPVAIICDSHSLNQNTIVEQRMWLESNPSLFASKRAYRVIMAVPELAAILMDVRILTRAFGVAPTESVILMGRYSPKDAFAEMNALSGRELSALQIAEKLTLPELQIVQSHPLVQELVEFLDQSEQVNGSGRSARPVELADA